MSCCKCAGGACGNEDVPAPKSKATLRFQRQQAGSRPNTQKLVPRDWMRRWRMRQRGRSRPKVKGNTEIPAATGTFPPQYRRQALRQPQHCSADASASTKSQTSFAKESGLGTSSLPVKTKFSERNRAGNVLVASENEVFR